MLKAKQAYIYIYIYILAPPTLKNGTINSVHKILRLWVRRDRKSQGGSLTKGKYWETLFPWGPALGRAPRICASFLYLGVRVRVPRSFMHVRVCLPRSGCTELAAPCTLFSGARILVVDTGLHIYIYIYIYIYPICPMQRITKHCIDRAAASRQASPAIQQIGSWARDKGPPGPTLLDGWDGWAGLATGGGSVDANLCKPLHTIN